MGSPKTKNIKTVLPEEAYDDKHESSTVVIDINKFRKELDSAKKQAVDEIPVEIEFNVHSSQNDNEAPKPENSLPETSPPATSPLADDSLSLDMIEESDDGIDLNLSQKQAIRTILFDFKSTKLKQLHGGHKSDDFEFHLVSELGELNKEIKSNQELIVIFYYNQAPKAINTLMKQLNSKFSHIKTMIIADNLSDTKAKAHGQTASGAQAYLSTPQSFKEVEKKLSEL